MCFSNLRARLLCAAVPLFFAFGCDDNDNDADTDAEHSLITTSAEAAGANCTLGGVAIRTGDDANGDSVLDDDEVTSTQYICKDSTKTVIATTTEPAGANCPFGGTKIEVGADLDGNSTLETDEVTSTQYACSADIYAQRYLSKAIVTTLDDVASLQSFVELALGLEIDLPADLPAQDITFANVRVIDRDLTIECAGTAATLHFPLLEAVEDSLTLYGGCGAMQIDAPKLKSIGSSMSVYNDIGDTLTLAALESVGYIYIQNTQLTSVSFPNLKSADYTYLYGNSLLDDCVAYEIWGHVASAGHYNDIYTYNNSGTCTDVTKLCPELTVLGSTNPFAFCYRPMAWSAARTTCQSLGSGWDLAFFTSDDDFAALRSLDIVQSYDVWLGYSEDPALIDGAVDGTYSWVQNVLGNTYAPQSATANPSFWEETQPDRSGGNEHCGQIFVNRLANDAVCSNEFRPLCRQLQ